MAIDNIIAIEDEIVTQLAAITGINQIYREPLTEGLLAQNVQTTSLWVGNAGMVPGQSVRKGKNQKITSLWRVIVICKKKDYMTIGGIKQVEVIKQLNGHQAPGWISGMVLKESERNEPILEAQLAMFPVVFGVEVVI